MSEGSAAWGPGSRARRVLWGVAAAVGGLPALATLVGLFGSWGWPFDLANSFRPQYAVVLLPIGVVAVLHRRPVAAVLFLGAGALNAGLVAPYLIGSGPDQSVEGARLTILSFNVGVSNPNREEVATYLAREAPDIAFLFESSFEWEDAIAREQIPMATVAVVPEGRVAGITVLAEPSLGARVVDTGLGPIDQAAAVEVTVGGSDVTVLGLHPPSPVGRSRANARDALLGDAGRWAGSQEGHVVVIGDLNTTPWSTAYRELQWLGRLHDTLVGFGLQPTWPSGWGPLMVPIGHALHTEGLVTVERRTGPSLGSAHRPLTVTLAVAGRRPTDQDGRDRRVG